MPVQTLGVPPSVYQAKGQSIANCFFGIQAPPCSVFQLPAFLWVGSKTALVEISCCLSPLDFPLCRNRKGRQKGMHNVSCQFTRKGIFMMLNLGSCLYVVSGLLRVSEHQNTVMGTFLECLQCYS